MATLKRFKYLLFSIALTLGVGDVALAYNGCPSNSTVYTSGILKGIPCDRPVNDIDTTVLAVKNITDLILLPAAGVIFSIMFMVGALYYVTSNGNTQRAEQGKKTLTWAILGLILIVLAEVLIGIFVRILGGSLV